MGEAMKVEASSRALKQRRATRACDSCHRRGIKVRMEEQIRRVDKRADRCDDILLQCVTNGSAGCESCISYGERCTSDRPVKRRGRASLAVQRSPSKC